MMKGIFKATKKDGSVYFRSSINRRGKKISLGSFDSEIKAHNAYNEAIKIYENTSITLDAYPHISTYLDQDKAVSLINFRDNGIFFKTPIYLREGYFSYFLKDMGELKFDNEDLFYYSSHTIMKRGGHLFLNDYGTQYSINSRYGIKAYAIEGKDYRFVNGDPLDFRYENILIINSYYGVTKIPNIKGDTFSVKIHINGEYNLGVFKSETEAAICYNKGADAAKNAGVPKSHPRNFIMEYSSSKYKEVYEGIELPQKYIKYLSGFSPKV